MVDVFVDEGVGREEEVEGAVEDGDIDAEDCDDGAEEEHLGWADDASLEVLGGGDVWGELGAVVGIGGGFSEAGGFSFEEDDGVGFTEDEEGDGGDDADLGWLGGSSRRRGDVEGSHSDGKNPEHPPPAENFGNAAADDGTYHRAENRAHRPNRHGLSSLFSRHHVGDRSRSNGDGSNAGKSRQKSCGQEHSLGL